MNRKLKYNSLNLEQKRMICTYNEQHAGIKQKQLIMHFTKEFKLDQPIKSSTMSDILKDSSKYLNLDENQNKKRLRSAMLPELEVCLYIWLCSKTALNIPISDTILIEKVRDFCDLFRGDVKYTKKIDSFHCSSGWLSKFKLRYNIHKHNIHGESGDVYRSELVKLRIDLKNLTNSYKLEDIYYMDETEFY